MQNKFFFILILVSSFCLSNAFAQTPKPKIINGGVINGKAISLPKPPYPPAAQAVRASGAVNVQVTIDENGDVISASAVSGHPLLRQAAEEAARASKFNKTLLSGQSVQVMGVIVYNFVPSEPAPSNEEELQFMGLGAFLSISNSIPSDEWDVVTKEELAVTPQIADELAPLSSITKETDKEKRAVIINKVIAAVGNKLKGADAWQFEFGSEFGAMMIELQKSAQNPERLLNETAIKTKLIRMRDLLITAPIDIPNEVLDKLKEMTKFAETPDLNSETNKTSFLQSLSETLDTISPGLSKVNKK